MRRFGNYKDLLDDPTYRPGKEFLTTIQKPGQAEKLNPMSSKDIAKTFPELVAIGMGEWNRAYGDAFSAPGGIFDRFKQEQLFREDIARRADERAYLAKQEGWGAQQASADLGSLGGLIGNFARAMG